MVARRDARFDALTLDFNSFQIYAPTYLDTHTNLLTISLYSLEQKQKIVPEFQKSNETIIAEIRKY